MNRELKIIMAVVALALVVAICAAMAAGGAIRESDRLTAEVDEFLASREQYVPHVTPVRTGRSPWKDKGN